MIPTAHIQDAILRSPTGWFARLPQLQYHPRQHTRHAEPCSDR